MFCLRFLTETEEMKGVIVLLVPTKACALSPGLTVSGAMSYGWFLLMIFTFS